MDEFTAVVLKDTKSGVLDVSPDCYGHRPRVCRRGLISRPSAHSCTARLLASEPEYDADCTLVLERRMPLDVVHPQASNQYVLITGGTDLAYRCEGRRELSTTVPAGVYKVRLEPFCSLYGKDWYLTATFLRTVNVSLQTQEVGFFLNVSLVDMLTDLPEFEPLITELKFMGDVERKELKIGDLGAPTQNGLLTVGNRFWHGFWTVPILAIGVGVGVVLWRRLRRAPAPSGGKNVEIELKPVARTGIRTEPSEAPFDFGEDFGGT